MTDDHRVSRRSSLKGLGALGAAAWIAGSGEAAGKAIGEEGGSEVHRAIRDKVWNSPLRNCWESRNTRVMTEIVARLSSVMPRIT